MFENTLKTCAIKLLPHKILGDAGFDAMSNFDVPTPLEPRSASALLLRVLRDCINRTNAVVACIQKWPEFEKQGTRGRKKQKTGEQEQQITQLIEVRSVAMNRARQNAGMISPN